MGVGWCRRLLDSATAPMDSLGAAFEGGAQGVILEEVATAAAAKEI